MLNTHQEKRLHYPKFNCLSLGYLGLLEVIFFRLTCLLELCLVSLLSTSVFCLITVSLISPCNPPSGHFLIVPKCQRVTKRDRAFVVWAHQLWNTLPGGFKQLKSVPSFKFPLETHFRHVAYSLLLFFAVVLYFDL